MKTNVPSNFIWLNLTQAIGSFMDNLFKMLTVFYLADALGLPLERTLAMATVLLVVQFIILSNLAGALADRYSKTKLIRIVKWAELALLALSFPAYFSGRAWPMLTVLTLLACQSAFFGPLKRGIIPEIVPSEAVAEANACDGDERSHARKQMKKAFGLDNLSLDVFEFVHFLETNSRILDCYFDNTLGIWKPNNRGILACALDAKKNEVEKAFFDLTSCGMLERNHSGGYYVEDEVLPLWETPL